MTLPSYQFLAQMSAAFAVVVSLGFVAFELKLARDIAMAQIYQDRTAMHTSSIENQMDTAALRQARKRIEKGGELSAAELHAFHNSTHIELHSADNTHYLYSMGLIPEEEWRVAFAAADRAIENAAKASGRDIDPRKYLRGYRESFIREFTP